MPMIAFIGVRISWLIAARNALFAALASSATSRASCASANRRAFWIRDPDVRRDRRQQPRVALAVASGFLDALHADHADRRGPTMIGTPRNERTGVPTIEPPRSWNASARLSSSGSRDLRISDVNPSPNARRRSAAPSCRPRCGTRTRSCPAASSSKRDVHDVRAEHLAEAVAETLDQRPEVELFGQRLADVVHDRHLGARSVVSPRTTGRSRARRSGCRRGSPRAGRRPR